MSIKILYEDENIAVCIKPAGTDSQDSNRVNMISLLNQQLGVSVFPVHRLDRETGGIMVYAKNQKAAADLSFQISNGSMHKTYYAVLNGIPENNEGSLTDFLYHDRSKNKSYVVKKMRKGVKDASLDYRIISCSDNLALAEIRLHTGRTHQIRVQFSSRNHPIYGDGKYGGGSGDLALFAENLEFLNPHGKEKLSFKALPDISKYPWSLFKEVLS